eukprot:CAMPEP_0113645418 /NCGR_PEP_ID=MMETSP0017_2-20120614/23939_1 /TAXON_ID=2856 /ORGANISM="Cylindrotheca closterium" /LENGTH=382 /DNA_ID=CAMNT_0000557151 /DNA_START=40 /DNA_END=1185 /DNA_ORIENTATION=- /assembly_acc=CAM_ASM_000147
MTSLKLYTSLLLLISIPSAFGSTGEAVPPNPTTSFHSAFEPPRDSVPKFLSDLSQLALLEKDHPILQYTESNRDNSYTKNWKVQDWERHQVRSFFRYRRHLGTWFNSTTANAVWPTVISLTCWALLIQLLAYKFESLNSFLKQPAIAKGAASFGAPISLLLALRTNRSLNRLLEARSMFGKYIRASGSLMNLIATHVSPIDKERAILLGRYLSIYGWCTKGFFRKEADGTLIQTMLPPNEAEWIRRQSTSHNLDAPSCIHIRVRSLLAPILSEIPLSAGNAMEDRLSTLESSLGVNKRLLGSPIPPTYTRHTSRVLCLYLGLIPFSLVGSNDGPVSATFLLSILLVVGATAYVLVGIDEIGVEIENPFPLIPMQALSKVIQN